MSPMRAGKQSQSQRVRACPIRRARQPTKVSGQRLLSQQEARRPPCPRHHAEKNREQNGSNYARVADLVPGIVGHVAGPSHTHELPAPWVTLDDTKGKSLVRA
jgi:hypothetical protein